MKISAVIPTRNRSASLLRTLHSLHNQIRRPDEILVVDASAQPQLVRARHFFRENLDGFVAILYLRQYGIYFMKYLGQSEVYLNGVGVKSGKISVLAVGSLPSLPLQTNAKWPSV